MRLVGFTGIKGSGKDTAAQVLTSYGFCHSNFADSVREVVIRCFNLSYWELTDRTLKEKPLDRWPFKSPRQLMQEVGDTMRAIDPEVWIRSWVKRYEQAIEYQKNVVCSDVRYPNEAFEIKKRGGVIIGVFNPRIVQTDFHISEVSVEQIDIDFELVNDFETASEFQAYTRNRLVEWKV